VPKKGYKQTKEHIQNHALAVRGHIPWNKGLTQELDERVARIGEMNRLRLIGKPWPKTQEHIEKIRQKLLGKPGCSKGKQIPALSKAQKGRKITWGDKISSTLKGRKQPPELVEKNRQSHLLYWQNITPQQKEEWLRNVIIAANIKPNKQELKLLDILSNVLPNEYEYTGDGKFIINGLCPDFTNVNGEKKVIELFGDYWHQGENPLDRIGKFAKFGFGCLVIWEHELNNLEELTLRIKEFNKDIIKSGK